VESRTPPSHNDAVIRGFNPSNEPK
jgi:hypothetical protein